MKLQGETGSAAAGAGTNGTPGQFAPARQPQPPQPPPAGGTVNSGAAEAEYLRRAQSGDRAAFGQFVLATQDRLYTLLVRIVGDREEAKELAQDAYLKALSALASFRHSSAPYTWLYRIAVNLAIARLRKVRRHRVFSLDAGLHDRAGSGDAPPDLALRDEQGRMVLAALGRLDSEYRAVLVMRDIDGLDYKDIADVLELPLGTVKSRLFRARLALREELNKYLSPGAQNAVAQQGAAQQGVAQQGVARTKGVTP